MIRYGKQYSAKFSEPEEERLYKQERLLFDATELISKLMEHENISRSELAKRIGKSKAYVTQVLRGKTNMTLRTLSDLTSAMGYSVALAGHNSQRSNWIHASTWQASQPLVVYRSVQVERELVPHSTEFFVDDCPSVAFERTAA